MNTGFLSQAVANGFVFTASQETLHALFPQQGDQTVDFFRFAESVGKNTAMFAAFAGMEKFVTGPWVERYLKGVSAATPIGKIGETLTLTAGDVAAMQILHAAETGNLEFGWEALFVALAFRIGMKGASERFPKLKEKFSKKTPQDQQKVVNEVQAKGEQPHPRVQAEIDALRRIRANNRTASLRHENTPIQNQIDIRTGVYGKPGYTGAHDFLSASEAAQATIHQRVSLNTLHAT